MGRGVWHATARQAGGVRDGFACVFCGFFASAQRRVALLGGPGGVSSLLQDLTTGVWAGQDPRNGRASSPSTDRGRATNTGQRGWWHAQNGPTPRRALYKKV